LIDQKLTEALGSLYLQHLKNTQMIEDLQKEISNLKKQLEEKDGRSN